MKGMGIGKRIKAAMDAAGLRPVDIARHLKIEDAAVHQWFKKDSGPRSGRIPDLARLLSVSVDELMQEPRRHFIDTNIPKDVRQAAAPHTLTVEYERSVPVYETEPPGSSGGDFRMGHDTKLRVRRPPKLEKRTDIIAFYVQGGGAPRFEIGDLIYCERHIAARSGDYVVVETKAGAFYLRKLAERGAELIRLVTHGAKEPLEIANSEVARVLRVMSTQDLLG